jgi:hypothetical protein
MPAKSIRVTGPTTQPSCAVAQARESTPEPMTAVMMCALAVHTVPDKQVIQTVSGFLQTAPKLLLKCYGFSFIS